MTTSDTRAASSRDPAAPSRRARWLLLLALAPPLAVAAWLITNSYFLCDDAFISFRYARNLLRGDGLVFNPGEYVEGYTNMLWVLEVAGLWAVGLRPEFAAPALSILLTAATLAVVAAAATRFVAPGARLVAAWIAVTWLATCPSFCEWSTSGLETRQFTLLVVLGAWLLLGERDSWAAGPRRLALASSVLALAELTRPEGLMLFCCAAGWRLVHDALAGTLSRRGVLALVAPFAAIVLTHFLWRYGYYGEWLPNTYYAKHVRAWHDSGARYLEAGAYVLGAFVWLPLALSRLFRRSLLGGWRHALPFALVVPHAGYLLHIGGDHFAFRPMDFYLPLMAPLAASAVVAFATWATRSQRALAAVAVSAAFALLLYAQAAGAASYIWSRIKTSRAATARLTVRIDAAQTPLLGWLPGMTSLVERLNAVRARMVHNAVAAPVHEHAEFWRHLIGFERYEHVTADELPDDLVCAIGSIGIVPFYLSHVTFIDTLGLTDATVARNPAKQRNQERVMAHDRTPPPGYLRERGANIWFYKPERDLAAALGVGAFAYRLGPDEFMPLEAAALEYPAGAFDRERLTARHRVDERVAANNSFRMHGRRYTGTRLLSTFATADEHLQWTCAGSAAPRPRLDGTYGSVGEHVLATASTTSEATGAGDARSSTFTCAADDHLLLLLTGAQAPGLRVDLCHGERVLHSITDMRLDVFEPVVLPMRSFAGLDLHLEVHDEGPGWLALDHVLVAAEQRDPAAEASRAWSDDYERNLAIVSDKTNKIVQIEIEPLDVDRARLRLSDLTVRFTNKLPVASDLRIELARGDRLLQLTMDEFRDDQGAIVAAVAPFKTATTTLHVRVDADTPLTPDWPLLRVVLTPSLGPEASGQQFARVVAFPTGGD